MAYRYSSFTALLDSYCGAIERGRSPPRPIWKNVSGYTALSWLLLIVISQQTGIRRRQNPPQLGLWWVHTIMLIIGVALIVRDRKTGTQFRAWILGKKIDV